MASVFQKLGGIRPMATKLDEPSSTVKSWHKKRKIPAWRHSAIMEAAARFGVELAIAEVQHVEPDDPDFQDAERPTMHEAAA